MLCIHAYAIKAFSAYRPMMWRHVWPVSAWQKDMFGVSAYDIPRLQSELSSLFAKASVCLNLHPEEKVHIQELSNACRRHAFTKTIRGAQRRELPFFDVFRASHSVARPLLPWLCNFVRIPLHGAFDPYFDAPELP